ncbi:tetratricopeptide repeat protein [Bradyrhizobium sp. AZCC 2289]|uniref:tetratricopeptide repeat protein n=1 Tax=Bradyrhizobium sp. AZCC 2289 TaxID=3117026 RepID=UPI002FF35E50
MVNKVEVGSHDWIAAMQYLAACNIHMNRPFETVSIYEKLLANPNGARYLSSDPTALSNLAVAYRNIGEQSHDPKMEQKSFEYLKQAYESDAGSSNYVKGQVRYNLAIANFQLGKETNNLEALREAARLFNQALEYINQKRDSSSWAHTQTNLGIAHLEIGKVTGEIDEFKKSIAAKGSALLIWQPGEVRDRWIDSTFIMTDAYNELARIEKKREGLDKVISTMKDAIEHIDHDSQSAQLMKAYLGVAASNFDLLQTYRDESCRADSKLYYEKAARLLAERVMSHLLTVSDAYPQAVAIQSRLDQLKTSASPKKSTSKKKVKLPFIWTNLAKTRSLPANEASLPFFGNAFSVTHRTEAMMPGKFVLPPPRTATASQGKN